MAVATVKRSGLAGTKGRRVKAAPWARPKDWPVLPPLVQGDQKFVGVYAVFDHDSNWCSFIATAVGGYTVDWGDGSAPQGFASAAACTHTYDFATTPGVATSEGFKVVVVTVTPTTGGANLTNINLINKSATAAANQGYALGWLDIRMAGAFTALVIGGGTNVVMNRNLRQFEFVGTHALPAGAGASFFSACTSLESVILPRAFTAGFNSMSSFFSGCGVLRSIPMLDTGASTNFTSMFSGCTALTSVPLLDTHLGTAFASMFQNCGCLEAVPPIDTSAATGMANMFQSCTGLKTIPLLDTHLVTSFSGTFLSCTSLRSIPALNTVACTTFASMMSGCTALETFPSINTSAGTNFSSMFNGCASLHVIGTLDMAAATSAANVGTLLSGCTSLSKSGITGIKYAHTYPGKMSAAELNRVYTNLGVASGAQAITVTGNYGVATDDPTIATAKGWTVTGS